MLSAGLKRKFQPPKRTAVASSSAGSAGGGSMVSRRPNSNIGGTERQNNPHEPQQQEDEELPEALRGFDKELVQKITSEILHTGDSITFCDIAGLQDAKQTVMELICWPMKRPDLFTGLRRGPNGTFGVFLIFLEGILMNACLISRETQSCSFTFKFQACYCSGLQERVRH